MIHVISDKDIPKELVVNSDKLIMIVFYGVECIPSEMVMPVLESVDKKYPNVEIYKINVDESEQYIMINNIKSTPTIIFYKDKEECERIVGLTSIDKISSIVDNYIKE